MDDRWEAVKKRLLKMNGQLILCQPYPDSEELSNIVMLFKVRVSRGFIFLVNTKTRIPKYFDNFVKEYKNCVFYMCLIGGEIV